MKKGNADRRNESKGWHSKLEHNSRITKSLLMDSLDSDRLVKEKFYCTRDSLMVAPSILREFTVAEQDSKICRDLRKRTLMSQKQKQIQRASNQGTHALQKKKIF